MGTKDKKKNTFLSIGDFSNPLNYDLYRHIGLFSAGMFAGFSLGSLASAVSLGFASYSISLAMGPSRKTLNNFYKKYVDIEKFPNFKVKKRKLSSKGVVYGSLMAFAGASAGAIVHPDFLDVVKSSGLDFSSLSLDQMDSLNDFGKKLLITSPLLFSTGLFLGESYDYIRSEMSFNKLIKSNFSFSPQKRLETILSNVNLGIANSRIHLLSELYNQKRFDEALSYFFEDYFIKNNVVDSMNNPFFLASPIILEKNNFPLKFRLAHALSESFPEPFIDGLVTLLVDESIKSKDTPALALAGFYLENNQSPDAQRVWEEVGNQLGENQQGLESKLFAQGTSRVMNINLSGNDVDIIKSTLLQKQKSLGINSIAAFADEKILNNKAYVKFIDDSSLDIPLLLHAGQTDCIAYSLMRLNRSQPLFNVAKNNLSIFKNLIVNWEEQTQKINSAYKDVLLSGEVSFTQIDYRSRIFNQEAFLGKDKFNSSLANKLLDRIDSSSQIDFLKPSIDNLPEQWLYDLESNIFSRLDFENKGLRRSMEDRVNSTLWVYDAFPASLWFDSLNFQVEFFCKENNVDFDVASNYFLDVLFERRNHLFTTWMKKGSMSNPIANLLSLSDFASRSFHKFSFSKSYLSDQRQQTNLFYSALKSI